MKVLVTGGAGFIASHLVDTLVDNGADVVCVDSLDRGVHSGPPGYLNPRAHYDFADLREWAPDDQCDDVEAVLHFAALGGVGRAAREGANVVAANVVGTARLVDSMARWPRLRCVVLGSSFSVYGSAYRYGCRSCGVLRDGERREEDLRDQMYDVLCPACGSETDILPLDRKASPSPLELYGASKLMQELCFRGFDTCPVTILRQTSIYGTRLRLDDSEATIIARMAGWIRAGVPPRLFEDGGQLRDWVHVKDTVDACLALLRGTEAPPVVNVCTGIPTTLIDACKSIAGALGSVFGEPEIIGGYRRGDMRHCLGDPADLAALLGRPPYPFSAGVLEAFSEFEPEQIAR